MFLRNCSGLERRFPEKIRKRGMSIPLFLIFSGETLSWLCSYVFTKIDLLHKSDFKAEFKVVSAKL